MATSSVWGICMARDEADIIATTVAHMLTQVDVVLVADNLSRDDTGVLAADAGALVTVDGDPAYWQSAKMTALAALAASKGAEWVVPFDADEIWHTRSGQRIGDYLTGLDADVAVADLYDHWPTAADPDVADPVRRMGWRSSEPGALPKVACRTSDALTIAMGNHAASYGETNARHARGELVVRHYPYRSQQQFVRKARQGGAALAATTLHRSVGAHWRQYAATLDAHGEAALEAHYFDAFYRPDPAAAGLVFDPAPLP